MRHLADPETPALPELDRLIADALRDHDWRVRMTALLAVARRRIASLARRALKTDIPPIAAGLRDQDRRALLALRDIAVARAEGRPLDQFRPVHSDPEIAARRAAFLSEVVGVVIAGTAPEPTSPALILQALAQPDSIPVSEAPAEWRDWLPQPD
jgi:hypothetical protein